MIESVTRLKQHHDLDVVIETPRGTIRRGPGWAVVLPYDYGYIRGTMAPDGEPVDCCVGPAFLSRQVYVVDTIHPSTKAPDEPKVMLAYVGLKMAMVDFLLGYSDNTGASRIGKVRSMVMDDFKSNELPWWKLPPRRQVHIHIHDNDKIQKDRFGRIIIDAKWTGTYTALVKGKQRTVEATVEASDAYTAGDRLREKFEKEYGKDYSYPVARFKGGPKRLDPESASRQIAMSAGAEED